MASSPSQRSTHVPVVRRRASTTSRRGRPLYGPAPPPRQWLCGWQGTGAGGRQPKPKGTVTTTPGDQYHCHCYLCLLLEAFLSGVLPSWNWTMGLEQASEFSAPISVLPSTPTWSRRRRIMHLYDWGGEPELNYFYTAQMMPLCKAKQW